MSCNYCRIAVVVGILLAENLTIFLVAQMKISFISQNMSVTKMHTLAIKELSWFTWMVFTWWKIWSVGENWQDPWINKLKLCLNTHSFALIQFLQMFSDFPYALYIVTTGKKTTTESTVVFYINILSKTNLYKNLNITKYDDVCMCINNDKDDDDNRLWHLIKYISQTYRTCVFFLYLWL